MSWSNRLRRKATGLSPGYPIQQVGLALPGWNEDAPQQDLRVWRDSDGDVLSLAIPAEGGIYPFVSDEIDQRRWCRELASGRGGGLIEVQTMPFAVGRSVSLIYKRLLRPAYIYTGMFITDIQGISLVWTIVASEHGTTGVRESVVTVNLMNAGKLTLDDYEHCWAQDPYEPTFHGVDRSVLRFMSDDKLYDEEFPQHPLSKVRYVLAMLPNCVQCEFWRP